MGKSTFFGTLFFAIVISIALGAPEPPPSDPNNIPIEVVNPTPATPSDPNNVPIEVVTPAPAPPSDPKTIPIEVENPTQAPPSDSKSIPVEVVTPTQSPPGTTVTGQSSNPKQDGMKPDAEKQGLAVLEKIPHLKILSSQAAQIQNAKLDSVAIFLKIILTPVVFIVAILLFSVRLLVKGLLYFIKGLVLGIVKVLGLGSLNLLLGSLLDAITALVDGLLSAVQCLLSAISYVPKFGKCESLN